MITPGRDADFGVGDLVDQPALICDVTRPIAREVVLERLRLADALIAVADGVLEEHVDALVNLPVVCLPPQVALPGVSVPDQAHQSSTTSITSWTSPSADSIFSIASSRRRAFVGDRIR